MQTKADRVVVVMGGNLWMYIADIGAEAMMQKFGVSRESALEAISQHFLNDPQFSSGFMLRTQDSIPTEVDDFTESNPCCIMVPDGNVMGLMVARGVDEDRPTDEWLEAKQRFDKRLSRALCNATVSLLNDYSMIRVLPQERESIEDVMEQLDDPLGSLEVLFDNLISHNGNENVLRRFSFEWRQVRKQQDREAAKRLLKKVLLHLDKEGIVL